MLCSEWEDIVDISAGRFGVGGGPMGVHYPPLQNCAWKIISTSIPSSAIQLTIDVLDLETDFDFLYVYDGGITNTHKLAALSGSVIPAPLVARSGMMVRD